MVSDRLFMGRQVPGGGAVTDSAWAGFVRDVVTPRFPGGFTVWRAEGQWRDSAGGTVSEATLVLEVLHDGSVVADSAVSAIAAEYRRRFSQQAVLRATSPALVRLHK